MIFPLFPDFPLFSPIFGKFFTVGGGGKHSAPPWPLFHQIGNLPDTNNKIAL